MATSGTYTYVETRNQIIYNALAKLEVVGVGLPIQVEDLNLGIDHLNQIVKSWQSLRQHQWKIREGVLFYVQYSSRYDVGVGGKGISYAADEDDTVITYTTATAVIGANTITANTVTNMAVGNTIGVVDANLATEWFTVSAINTSTKVITLSGNLTVAVNLQASIYTFSVALTKPLSVLSARRVYGVDLLTSSTRQEITLKHYAYEDFRNIPIKTMNSSTQVGFSYRPYSTFGRFQVWPRPADCSQYLQFTYEQQIQDWTNPNDTPDFPVEWTRALTYALAIELAPIFGKTEKLQALWPIASALETQALEGDEENTYIQFVPNDSGQIL